MSTTTINQENLQVSPATDQNTVVCVNCQHLITEKHCSNCGQPKLVKRISFKAIAGDIYDRIFGMDNKFARTIGRLSRKPEEVLNSIFKGNRVKYMGAGSLYFILLTLYLILFSLLDVTFEEVIRPSQEMFATDNMTLAQQEFNKKITNMIFQNFRIFSFLMIPFFTWGLMIFFRKAMLNFFEHAVIVLYSLALGLIFNIIFLLSYKFFDIQFNLLHGFISIAILGYMCSRFFKGRKVLLFVKGVFAYLVGYVFFLLFFMAIILTAMVIDPSLIPR